MKRNTLSKRHHYLPQSYLSGFTSDGTKNGKFLVIDKSQVDVFPTKPLNVAVESHFNRIEYKGKLSDVLERKLATVEGEIALALEALIRDRAFPTSENLNKILNLIAVIRTHNPRVRKENQEYWHEKFCAIGEKVLEAREGRLSYEGLLLESGEPVTDDDIAKFNNISNEEIKRRAYSIQSSQNAQIREEFDDMNQLLHLLRERSWTILLAPTDKPGFLSSDDPVSLIGSDDDRSLLSFRARNTEVIFPVSSHVALMGVYGHPKSRVQTCEMEFVGSVNYGMIRRAVRFIYSRDTYAAIRWREETEVVPLVGDPSGFLSSA